MTLKCFIYLFLFTVSFVKVYAQDQDTQQQKTYSIDFSGLKDKPAPKNESESESSTNSNIESLGFFMQNAHLSQNAIKAFNIKSIIDIDNFGKEKKDHLKFGKPSDTKTYLDAGYEPLALKTDSVDFFFGDIDLGSFDTKSDHLFLIVRDSRAIDGDEIKVVLNNKTIFSRITFSGQFNDYRVALEKGFNNIELLAIDSGLSEPVTCQIIVIDGLDQKLFEKSFSIAVGYKAKFLIIRK